MSDQAAQAKQCIANILATIERVEEELAQLDAFAGDGDHGAGMVRGMRAAQAAAQAAESAFVGPVIEAAGTAFTNSAGGASGALFGMFITTVGQTLNQAPDADNIFRAIEAGVNMVCEMGGAKVGDKTMVDTLVPFTKALEEGAQKGLRPVDAWIAALPAAKGGMEATANMMSNRGRSSRLGERSVGKMDPGAVSTYYMLQAVADTLTASAGEDE